MDEKDKIILKEIQQMTEENNKILKKMNRKAFWASISSLMYWVVIIGASLGAYYYLEPYVDKFKETYQTVKAELSQVQNVTKTLGNITTKK
jgi:hypothetical protein